MLKFDALMSTDVFFDMLTQQGLMLTGIGEFSNKDK